MRVVFAENFVLLREGLVRLLEEASCQVRTAVGDGPALVDGVAEHAPDVSVVDIRVPPTHTDEGLRAAVQIRRRQPGAKILVLSQHVEASYGSRIARAASATCSRTAWCDVDELTDAVQKHIGNIFGRLALAPSESAHRRVMAVLTYLRL